MSKDELQKQMDYYSRMLHDEYGLSYEANWELLEDIAEKHDLDLTIGQNLIWAVLEAENIYYKKYGLAYSWKHK